MSGARRGGRDRRGFNAETAEIAEGSKPYAFFAGSALKSEPAVCAASEA
jgi:hypothetical protein